MNRIVAIRKDDTGSIAQYKLDDGRILSRQDAITATNRGEISGVSSFTTRDGSEAIRSDRGQADYSLKDLPEF